MEDKQRPEATFWLWTLRRIHAERLNMLCEFSTLYDTFSQCRIKMITNRMPVSKKKWSILRKNSKHGRNKSLT